MKTKLGFHKVDNFLRESFDIVLIVMCFITLLATMFGVKRFVIDQPENRTVMAITFYVLTLAFLIVRLIQNAMDIFSRSEIALDMNILAIGLAALIGLSQAIWMHEIKKKIET